MTTYRKNVLHDAILMMYNPIIRITHQGIGTQVLLPNLENYINGKIKVSKDGESLAQSFWESLEALPFPDGTKWDDYTPGGLPENNWRSGSLPPKTSTLTPMPTSPPSGRERVRTQPGRTTSPSDSLRRSSGSTMNGPGPMGGATSQMTSTN